MREVWKAVPKYERRYEVSTQGRVRSLSLSGRGSNSRKSKTRLLSHVLEGGYARVGLWDGKKVRLHRVHRLVTVTFALPKRADQNTVNHRNGNKLDNRVSNLEWATMHEQNLHKYTILGLKTCQGIRNGSAKLTEDDIRAIRNSYKQHTPDHSYSAIARRFNVSKATVARIVQRITWSHVA